MRGSATKLAIVVAAALGAAAIAAAQEGPKSVAEAVKMEAGDALPITGFYDAPKSLAATRPGALLRQQAFDGYQLPAGVRAVRILYHSKDAGGRDVASSGVVLIPPGQPPAGGWPIIVWAHGTSGVARQCAPSLMKDVYYGEEGLFPMVRAGYAVVAPDYHGLGTAGVHQYVNRAAQVNDVVYAVPAARAAVPVLGARWVVDGHSQGGMAAWGVAEAAPARRGSGYLGAVAVAPGVRIGEALSGKGFPTAAGFYLDYMAWAIWALTPSFKPSDMLTGPTLARYPDLTTKGCFYYAYAHVLGDAAPPKLKPGWNKAAAAQRFFAGADVGRRPIKAPLLVVAGEADQTVPISAVRAAVRGACTRGYRLDFRSYPGLDHDPTMDKSTPDQLAWIADRFAGKPASNFCARED
jgi:pimeloyl-ACP methyl ester carboxylesterase